MEQEISQINEKESINGKRSPGGCLQIFGFVVSLFWTVGIALITMTGGWFIEQTIVEGSIKIPDLRWIFMLVGGFFILVPMLIFYYFSKSSFKNQYYRTWAIGAIFMLLMFPARFLNITDFQAVMIIQAVGMIVFIIGMKIWLDRLTAFHNAAVSETTRDGMKLALLVGLLTIFPWLFLGALGSVMDMVTAILNSALFGIAAALLVRSSLLSVEPARRSAYRFSYFLSDGLAASVALLIMSAAIGQDGNQFLMVSLIPILGWGCVLLTRFGQQRQSNFQVNWQPMAILVGLSVLWPLVWVDPDELMMVIGLGAGESLSVAGKATWIGLLISAVSIGLLWFFRVKMESLQRLPWFLKAAPYIIIAGAAALFILVGAPGLFGERLFVILKDQADVSFAENISDYSQRRSEVYQTLINHAEETQKDMRSSLDRLGVQYQPYYLVNAIEVTGGPVMRLWLQTRPDVDRILNNPVLRPLPEPVPAAVGSATAPATPEWNLTSIGADRVWSELNISGKGVVVGQSDSGVQGDHPELVDSYRGLKEGDDYNWYDPWNHTATPTDIGGHGTHTLGSILGNHVGVAPDAKWIGCVNLARNLGNPAYYLDCMQFMLAPFPQGGNPFKDGKPEKGAMVLNNSWGCPDVEGCDPEVFLPAVKALQSAGIFVVVSAGNSGYSGCGSVDSPPAIYKEVYSVGALGQNGSITDFSSLGPVMVDGIEWVKPDIAAPGGDVLSSYPGNTYEIASGTSMAGPHVAGVVALIWSANPNLIGNIAATRKILDQSASIYDDVYPQCVDGSTTPNNAVGFGKLNAYQAVMMALQK